MLQDKLHVSCCSFVRPLKGARAMFPNVIRRQNSFSSYRRTYVAQIQTVGEKRNEPLYFL